jgi:hypothetical protein
MAFATEEVPSRTPSAEYGPCRFGVLLGGLNQLLRLPCKAGKRLFRLVAYSRHCLLQNDFRLSSPTDYLVVNRQKEQIATWVSWFSCIGLEGRVDELAYYRQNKAN